MNRREKERTCTICYKATPPLLLPICDCRSDAALTAVHVVKLSVSSKQSTHEWPSVLSCLFNIQCFIDSLSIFYYGNKLFCFRRLHFCFLKRLVLLGTLCSLQFHSATLSHCRTLFWRGAIAYHINLPLSRKRLTSTKSSGVPILHCKQTFRLMISNISTQCHWLWVKTPKTNIFHGQSSVCIDSTIDNITVTSCIAMLNWLQYFLNTSIICFIKICEQLYVCNIGTFIFNFVFKLNNISF